MQTGVISLLVEFSLAMAHAQKILEDQQQESAFKREQFTWRQPLLLSKF